MLNETAMKKPNQHPAKQKKQLPTKVELTNMVSRSAGDGVDHINIDNNCGKTALGRLLANFAETPFTHPEYGPFVSLEAFWHWIRFDPPKSQAEKEQQDLIRGYYGHKARAFARNLNKGVYVANFKEEVINAIYYKIVQNQNLYDMFVASTLPFCYYYVFGPKKIEISPDYAGWLCAGVEQIRDHLKKFGKDAKFVYKE